MRAVKGRDTIPELAVRKLLRELGEVGYRLNRKDLPGKPDIAFVGRRKAVFVHGCFWHGHDCGRGARSPRGNAEYWTVKIARNKERDTAQLTALAAIGWNSLVVWECELRELDRVRHRLARFLKNGDATRKG